MSWQNNPKIRDLEPYAKKHGYAMVIVMAVSVDCESFDVTTYGRTRSLCDKAKIAGDQLYDLIEDEKWPDRSKIDKGASNG